MAFKKKLLSRLRKIKADFEEDIRPTKLIEGKLYRYRGEILRGDYERGRIREDMAKARRKWRAKGHSIHFISLRPIKVKGLFWPDGSILRGYSIYTRKK